MYERPLMKLVDLYTQLCMQLPYFNDKSGSYQSIKTRFHAMPTFGWDTICKFHNNASAMKKLAAHHFEDLLQVKFQAYF